MTSSRNYLCRNFGPKYLETKPDNGMVPMHSLGRVGEPNRLPAYHFVCLSALCLKCIFSGTSCWNWTEFAPNDVTWPYDVITGTSWFFCKMLLFRQCSPIYCMSAWSPRIVDPGLMSLQRANLIAYRLVYFFSSFFQRLIVTKFRHVCHSRAALQQIDRSISADRYYHLHLMPSHGLWC